MTLTLMTPAPSPAVPAAPPRPGRTVVRRRLDAAEQRRLRHVQRIDPVRPARVPTPPPPAVWAGNLSAAVVDVVRGLRPYAQLRRWIAPEIGAALEDAMRARPALPIRQRPGSVRAVRAVHLGAGVVEAAVSIDDGRRRWIVALRLETVRGRWLATALELA